MVKPKSLRKHQKPRRPKLCETESKQTLVWSSERVREREQWRAVIWHAYAKERYNAFYTLFKRFAHLRFFIISLSFVFVCVFFSASSAMQTNFNVQVLETRFYLSLKDGLLIRLKVDSLWTWNKYTDLIANSNKLAKTVLQAVSVKLATNFQFIFSRVAFGARTTKSYRLLSLINLPWRIDENETFRWNDLFVMCFEFGRIKINWLCIDLTCCCVDTERGGFQSLCLPEYIKSRFVESKNRFLWILGYTREYFDWRALNSLAIRYLYIYFRLL